MTAEATEPKRTKREKRKVHVRMSEAQAVLGWGVILLVAAVLGAIYLIQTSRIASTGRLVQELQFQLDETKRESSELERDIAEAESLKRLQVRASQLGFIKALPADVEYLVVKNYPTEGSSESNGSRSPSQSFENFGQALWKIVTGNLRGLVRGESQ